jgi:hypothetical protein
MSITITFPVKAGDVTRLASALAEPCLVAAAALAGAGPLAQALVAGAVRLTRGVDVRLHDGDLCISFE